VLNATTAPRFGGSKGILHQTANSAAVDNRQICRFSIGRRVTTIPVRLPTRLSWTESAFRADAAPQFIPTTARIEALLHPFDREQVIPARPYFCTTVYRKFHTVELAVAAYNANNWRTGKRPRRGKLEQTLLMQRQSDSLIYRSTGRGGRSHRGDIAARATTVFSLMWGAHRLPAPS
jgi:hypothetical protein